MVISEKEKTKAEKGIRDQGWGSKQVTLLYIVEREGLMVSEIIFDNNNWAKAWRKRRHVNIWRKSINRQKRTAKCKGTLQVLASKNI